MLTRLFTKLFTVFRIMEGGSAMAEELAEWVRIVRGGLHGVEVSCFREDEAVVLVRKHLSGGGTGCKRDAQFAGQ